MNNIGIINIRVINMSVSFQSRSDLFVKAFYDECTKTIDWFLCTRQGDFESHCLIFIQGIKQLHIFKQNYMIVLGRIASYSYLILTLIFDKLKN